MMEELNNLEELFKIEENVLKSTIGVSCFYRMTLADEIIKSMKKSADKVIIIDGVNDLSLTGHQVLTEVLKLASSLIGQGLTKGDVVAFYTDFKNLTLNAIGFMATIIAGLIYTARDNEYPYEEFLQLCKRSKVTVLVASESTLNVALRVRDELPEIKHIFILDKLNSSSNRSSKIIPHLFNLPSLQDDLHFPVSVDPEKDIAVIGFSSGSTGIPKAVGYTHRNVLCFSTMGLEPFNIASRPDSIILVGAPMYHIVDLEMFISTLYHGNQMVLYPVNEHWLVYAAKYRATTVIGFPSDINFFAKHLETHSIECVTDLVITGSNIDPKTCEQFINNYKVQQIRNYYGSTETGGISVALNGMSVNCSGIILPGTQVKIVYRKNGKLCEPNEVGVICAKTPMAALGYLNNEEANQEAFDNDGFYDTGDAGYFDNSGFIYITDRYKETFDCDGEAVSPTEIEQVLMKHEAVAEVAVFGRDHDIYGKVAKAFVVLRPNENTSEAELIQFISEKLVYYKHLFGGVELMSKFPRTPRGKIDRKLLKNKM